MGAGSLLWIYLERKREEIFEDLREGVLLFDLRCTVGSDQPQRSKRRLGQVGRFALDHLDGHDAQRPDIYFAAVLLACDHLGCHPIWSTDHCCSLVLRFVDGGAETKIGCAALVLVSKTGRCGEGGTY